MYNRVITKLWLIIVAICISHSDVWAAYKWVKTDIGDLKTGDVVVIVDGHSKCALWNDNGTSESPKSTKVSLQNSDTVIKSGVAAGNQWRFVLLANGNYKFEVPGEDTYLYCNTGNTGLRVGTSTYHEFSINDGFLYSVSRSMYIGIYESSSLYSWRSYASTSNISDTQIAFFKKTRDAELSSISVTGTPETFYVGDAWNTNGITVTAHYADDTTQDVTSVAEYSGYDNETTGTQEITVSYTEEGVTKSTTYNVTVAEKEKHTISWMVNGQRVKTAKVNHGDTFESEFPEVADINGKVFRGWVLASSVASDYSGDFVDTATATSTANITYYAVFATRGEDTPVTGKLTSSEIESNFNTKMEYADAEKSYNDTSDKIVWSARGTKSGTNNWIQLRDNSDTPSYVKAVAPSDISSVKILITDDEKSGDVNTMKDYYVFTGTVYLESEYSYTKEHTLNSSTVPEGKREVTMTVSTSTNVVYIQTSMVGKIWGVEVTYKQENYEGYTTTPQAVATSVTVGTTGYATFVYPYAVKQPEGIETFVVTQTPTTSVRLTTVAGDIPANTPVVLKGTAATYDMELADGDVDAIAGNLLQVSDKETSNGVYVLSVRGGVVGFYKWTGDKLGAGRVYIDAPEAETHEFLAIDDSPVVEEPTGVGRLVGEHDDASYYNLKGQRMAKPAQGIVIKASRSQRTKKIFIK